MTDPPPEMFGLPPLEDIEYWEKNIAAGLHQPEPPPPSPNNKGYTWVDLASAQYATPPDPPAIEGILYAGRRHVLSGPPESLKTLVAYMLLLSALRAQEGVCILDFEMGPHAAATLLRELGATNEELQAIHYTEPNAPPATQDLERIIGLGVGYCLVDAAAGAYDTTGLDDNSRKDAETFAAAWIRPLWQHGIATIVIDHVTKDASTRGKFAIGSERKTGQADIHLALEALKTLHRGGTGMVKVHVHKDRPGHLPRPTATIIDLHSHPDTHHLTWAFRDPHPTDEQGTFRPTIYMEKVSRQLEKHTEALSGNQVQDLVGGKRDYVREALDVLVVEGHVSETRGARNARLFTSVMPYRKPENDLSPPVSMPNPAPTDTQEKFANSVNPAENSPNDLSPTSTPPVPGDVPVPSPPPPPTGGGGARLRRGEEATSPRPKVLDVYDPEIQKLLDKEIPF